MASALRILDLSSSLSCSPKRQGALSRASFGGCPQGAHRPEIRWYPQGQTQGNQSFQRGVPDSSTLGVGVTESR
eukprot:2040098-Amphidinium_carterae.1